MVFQDLPRITRDIQTGDFFKNSAFLEAMGNCREWGSALHLMGLLSDGGVHSHITHLFALLKMAKEQGIQKVYVHCFLDGRDVPPSSGKSYVEQLQAKMEELGVGQIATVMGRYYAWTATALGPPAAGLRRHRLRHRPLRERRCQGGAGFL